MDCPALVRSRFFPPPDCNRILIVGAGGFGREVLQWAREVWVDQSRLIAGFLARESSDFRGSSTDLPVVDDPSRYNPGPGDWFLLGIGVPGERRRVAEDLAARGAKFLTLVHGSAIVSPTAEVGEGSVLCPFSIVSDRSRLGRFVIVNYHASLGHDASAGDFSVMSPYATLGGNAHIDQDVFLGLHASVGPGKSVGRRTKISANSCALSNAPADAIVFGAPGRVVARVALDTGAYKLGDKT